MTLRLRAPSSKSMTQRALILAALSDGPCTVDRPLVCDDSRYLTDLLRALGVSIVWHDEHVEVEPAPLVAPPEPVFCGNAGTAVRFTVEPGLEGSLAALVDGMLPLCSAAAAVADYVESRQRFEGGLIAHALAAEMQELLQDWRTMVVQLEHQRNVGRLSLQSAWFYVQPAVGAMSLLARVARRAPNLRGASLLNEIHREAAARAGDATARDLLLRLLRAASAPYAKAVERWVYEGVVDDPYDEFLVIERTHLRKESLALDYNATYWHARYTLRSEIPAFLGEGLAEKALTTGKYINAMRESQTSQTEGGGGRISRRAREGGEASTSDFSLPPIPPDGLGRLALGGGASSAGANAHASRINAAHKHASVGLLRESLAQERGNLRSQGIPRVPVGGVVVKRE